MAERTGAVEDLGKIERTVRQKSEEQEETDSEFTGVGSIL